MAKHRGGGVELATSCQFVGDASSTISLSLSLSPSDILSVIRSLAPRLAPDRWKFHSRKNIQPCGIGNGGQRRNVKRGGVVSGFGCGGFEIFQKRVSKW